MRKPVIAGNWKMNKTNTETEIFFEEIKKILKENIDNEVNIVICPPFTSLQTAVQYSQDTNIKIGSQNVYWEKSGAYTGEVSISMLKDIGVEYCIIGHSERRALFCETDETVNKKIKAVLSNNLIPIVCVGETLEQREKGKTYDVCGNQVEKALYDIQNEELEKIIIAYEPIWAIGTGKTASAEDAEKVILYIREKIADLYSENTASRICIQYGGSVKPENTAELMKMPNIDGALVGGASLKPQSFAEIIELGKM
jgi:triosephosphate isomerase